MGMAVGGRKGVKSDPNIVPLIDILLVLLIIFMVITPLTPKGLDALVPQPPPPDAKPAPTDRTVVIQVEYTGLGNEPGLKINQDAVTFDTLQARLEDIYKTRAERVVFVKGSDDLPFSEVVRVIDIAHAAQIEKVGLITAKIEAGQ